MASPLFKTANRRMQAAARQQFRRSNFGQLLSEVERLRKSPSAMRKFRTSVSELHRGGILDELRRGGIGSLAGQVQKYAIGRGAGDPLLGALFGALGPLGGLLQTLFHTTATARSSVQRELDSAISLLEAFGFEVLPPPGKRRTSRPVAAAKKFLEDLGYLPTDDKPEAEAQPVAPRPSPRRPSADDGKMIPVAGSSNVHSFGYDADNGALRIRFLQSGKNGRKVAGPTYEYTGVPPEVFQRMRAAASKGTFVWESIRIRGTFSGHRYDYRLAGIAGGYVPRKAVFEGNAEFFRQREFRKAGKVYRSNLPDALAQRMTGAPNRGTPNRGTPNRGR